MKRSTAQRQIQARPGQLCLIVLCILLGTVTCNLPTESGKTDTDPQPVPVTLNVPQVIGDGNSTYRVIITGEGMDTVGPLTFPTSQSVTVAVPQKNGLRIFCGKYDSSGALLDSGSITVDVVTGMGPVAVTLATVLAPPHITRNPVAVSIAEGETTMFSVAADGMELLFKRQRDGADITGATGEQLTTGATRHAPCTG